MSKKPRDAKKPKRIRRLQKPKPENPEILSRSVDGLHSDLISPDRIRKAVIDTEASPKFDGYSLAERNLILLEAATNIFDLREDNWGRIKKTISEGQIRELYGVINELWHPKGEYYETLPPPDSQMGLKAFYSGGVEVPDLTRNIFRFQLYTDTIFVPSPFQVPAAVTDEFSPLSNPSVWKADTLKNLYFLLKMEPWIAGGAIQLIPDPNEFDADFRIASLASARKRVRNHTLSKLEISETNKSSKTDFSRTLYELPREFWEQAVKKLSPRIDDSEIDAMWSYVKQQREMDPLSLNQSEAEMNNQLRASHAGFNLETTLLLTDQLGAFPYTNLRMRWREFASVRPKLSEEARIWTPLSEAFRELDFCFLEEVDSRFAFEMREEQRLASFRSFLRKLWMALQDSSTPSDSTVRDFKDELVDEFRKAQGEWQAIDTELIKWIGKTGAAAATAGVASLASGAMAWIPPVAPAVGFIASSVFKLIETHRKRREYRLKNPMSVFVDLANK